ncbi:MAG: hypothetical protein KAU28_07395 [Phycisphaerae bacterium]|nr:hypothetical protein [Phycisphaerae bacterium]
MKVELHLHTNRYSGCAVNSPQEMMSALVESGYDAVYITEHNAVWSDGELTELQAEFPAIRIFGGMELSLGDDLSTHLLVLGTNDPQYLTLRNHPAAVMEKAQGEGHLTVLAHPFRWEDSDEMLRHGLLPDAIELRSCNLPAEHAFVAQAAAEALNLKFINAGDAHSLEMIGRFWIETDRPIERTGDIRRIILDGAYKNRSLD